MKKLRLITSLILSVLLISTCVQTSFASSEKTQLLNIYADGMLFQQNEEAIFEGTGIPGSKITVELKDNGITVASGEGVVSADGIFFVSFISPEGSFKEYEINLYSNNVLFRTLRKVVFGELWLASGQSNMQYPLAQDKEGAKLFRENKALSKWIRVLMVPPYPEYNGSTSKVPAIPQNDISDAVWIDGTNGSIYSMSAVAYFFAESLQKELGMPIGILNSNLGGSTISSWLGRDAIDADNDVRNYLKSKNQYIDISSWNEDEQDIYRDMTANYNQKIAPLENFRPAGMIWYQGESDLMLGNTEYGKHLDLLQKSYTELFNYEKGLFPIIFTQLASYYYSDDGLILSDWNISFSEMQKAYPDSRALTTIYDIPVSYVPEAGLIHPEHKKEVGERMAFCANGLVYNTTDSFTAPYIKDFIIEDSSIFVTFSNVGDSLICKDSSIRGFTVCGKDGIFVDANAEIVSFDTVRIYNDSIASPVEAAYAYGVQNQTSNLYASLDGEATLPVSTFVTDNNENYNHWFNMPWTYCDSETVWYTEDDSLSGYYNSWTGGNASVTIKPEAATEGNGCLEILSDKKSFSVSPTLTYKDGISKKNFKDVQTDYSDYGQISFYIKNDGANDIVFDCLKIYKNSAVWYTPEVTGTLDCSTVIPADGDWHIINLDLNRLYHLGNECSLSYDNETIDEIKELEFCFTDEGEKARICIDGISFSASAENPGTRYDVDIKNADNIFEIFTGIFLTIIEKFATLF